MMSCIDLRASATKVAWAGVRGSSESISTGLGKATEELILKSVTFCTTRSLANELLHEQDKVLETCILMMSQFLHKYQPKAVLQVTGEDAAEYLQSQCSADLEIKRDNFSTYGLWLSRKGKVEGDSFVLQRSSEDFLLVSYHCSGDALREKILSNAVADDVEIEDRTTEWSGISLWGTGLSDLLASLNITCPKESTWSKKGEIHVFGGRRSRDSSLELVGPLEEIDQLVDGARALVREEGGRELDSNEVHLARIDARIPAIPEEIGPGELPQEGFLEKEAVSFDKGCFLGQEVMARLRSRGGVQRNLWLVECGEKGFPHPRNSFWKTNAWAS